MNGFQVATVLSRKTFQLTEFRFRDNTSKSIAKTYFTNMEAYPISGFVEHLSFSLRKKGVNGEIDITVQITQK